MELGDSADENILIMYPDSVAGLPKPKRRKTEIACEACRIRKSKCDGLRPSEYREETIQD